MEARTSKNARALSKIRDELAFLGESRLEVLRALDDERKFEELESELDLSPERLETELRALQGSDYVIRKVNYTDEGERERHVSRTEWGSSIVQLVEDYINLKLDEL